MTQKIMSVTQQNVPKIQKRYVLKECGRNTAINLKRLTVCKAFKISNPWIS